MAILAECPSCHSKQSKRNKLCSCAEDLDKAKRSKRVRYWIDYRLPDGKQKREPLSKFDDLDPYSIIDAQKALAKRTVQVKERTIFDVLIDIKGLKFYSINSIRYSVSTSFQMLTASLWRTIRKPE